ncbi:MAG TPA: class I SAM-dependent methyltransferase [Pyrinomonadaceae bacterium]|jgi:cyclopropane fatty-acyl-phospholipid synthase-like methyltransferase|nr:class I SAM-dependent methyltransferase [Pyrinomonadaceae bacterium]
MKRSHSFTDDAFLAAVTKVYDDGWFDYARTWKERDDLGSEEWRQFTAAVKPGGSVLDVGCNSGRDTKQLLELGYRVTGLDVSEQALRQCREQCPEARTIKMSLLDLADLKEQFDGIWFSYVLVHIPFRLVPNALAALESVLHPEGSMMMTVTVVEEPQERIHDSCVMFDEHGTARKVPVAHWAPDPLIALFRSRFEISWVSLKPFVDGYAQLSLLVRSRRQADNQEH